MRIIGHLDMDAFFAAVEERDKARIKGLPIAVGSDPDEGRGRGVVSTANYKAREYGIHSALPISTAWKLSQKAKNEGKPEVVFLPVDFKKYGEVSGRIMEIIRIFVPVVEEASIDEAYFDLSFCKNYEKAEELGKKIKAEILKKEKLTCSVGIGPNKLIAKISSGFKKPNGFTVIKESEAEDFLEPLKIRDIPGIGPKSEIMFNKLGIKTVKELKKLSKAQMDDLLGKWGDELHFKIRGVDDSPLVLDWEVKSIGEQETFLHDTRDANEVIDKVKQLAHQVFRRFKEKRLPAGRQGFGSFKTIAITVRFSDFETKSRAHTLKEPAKSPQILEFETLKLLLPFLDKRENPRQKGFRLLGVKIEKFD